MTNFQPGPISTDLSRDWGNRLPNTHNLRPRLVDELYGWIESGTAPALQPPNVVAAALADLLESAAPPLAGQSGADSERFVAAAMREPSRNSELHAMLAHFAGSSAPESVEQS